MVLAFRLDRTKGRLIVVMIDVRALVCGLVGVGDVMERLSTTVEEPVGMMCICNVVHLYES